MKPKPLVLVLALVLAAPIVVPAQRISVYFAMGYNNVDMAPLVDFLDRSQPFVYGTLPEQYYSFGLGLRIGLANWRVGWDLHYMGRDGTPPGVGNGGLIVDDSRLSDTQFLIDVQYVLVRTTTDRFTMAPSVGIGLETTSLSFRVSGVEGQPRDFDGILADPGRGVQLTRHNLLLDTALQADYALRLDAESGERQWILGLRAGYHYLPVGFTWQQHIADLGGRNVENGPEFGMAGPYVRLTLEITL